MSSASFASDWNLPRSQLRSECLPCAVFKVRRRTLLVRQCGIGNGEWGMNCSGNLSSYASSSLFRGFACANPQNDTVETIFSQYINWSYGSLHFRFACLPCYLIPWLGSGVSGFSFHIPHSQFPILRYRPKVSELRSRFAHCSLERR